MDISDALDIIDDTLIEYFESRNYMYYSLHTILMQDKISYEEYKKLCAKNNVKEEVFDVEDRKKEAEETLKRFIEGAK